MLSLSPFSPSVRAGEPITVPKAQAWVPPRTRINGLMAVIGCGMDREDGAVVRQGSDGAAASLSPVRLVWMTHSLHISPMMTHTLPPHTSPTNLSGLRPLRSLRVLYAPAKNFQRRIRSGSTSCGALCSAHTVSHASMNSQHALSPSSRTCSAISPSPPASVDGGGVGPRRVHRRAP